MPPEHTRSFGGGATETSLSPIVLIAMVVAVVLILVLPRKYAIVPLLVITFLAPMSQQIVLGGVHLYVSRLVILAGLAKMLWAKIATQGDILAGRFNSVDRAYLLCTLCEGIAVVLLFLSVDAVVNQVGFFWDSLGAYFLLRFLIQDEQDFYRMMKCLAFVVLAISMGMVIEQTKQVNVFGLFLGGTRITPTVRDGLIRSQGPFLHELLAGAFGATLLPLFCLLWKNGESKFLGGIGVIGSMLMTWTSNSSTSLSAFAAGILAMLLWPVRKKMKTVRWGIVIGLIALQLVMKAPVWFVIAHIDLTGSSSAWHRAAIVDQFIRHFSDWWLIGAKDTGSWGWDMWDTQNQFVSVGETGGLAAFILFITMISRCFSRLGGARKAAEGNTQREWLFWFLGAALFSHIVGFFGVNYFDQSRVGWFALLAMISAATAPLLRGRPAKECETEPTLTNNAQFAYPKTSAPGATLRELSAERDVQFKPRSSDLRQRR